MTPTCIYINVSIDIPPAIPAPAFARTSSGGSLLFQKPKYLNRLKIYFFKVF